MGSLPERYPIQGAPYARWIAIGGSVVLLVVLAIVLASKPQANMGVEEGRIVPPFAVPLASGRLEGGADIALHAREGERGRVPACRERGEDILNICQVYEKGPVVLALFIDGGSCPAVLKQMQAGAVAFPQVSFVAVAVKGAHSEVRKLVHREHLSIPVGFDRSGLLASLYKMASCPQLSFIEQGGVMQSKALLEDPSQGVLMRRVRALVAASTARGERSKAASVRGERSAASRVTGERSR